MFNRPVSVTPFTNKIADYACSKIPIPEKQLFSGDDTFLATARALLLPRIPEDEELYIQFYTSDYRRDTLGSATKDQVMRALAPQLPSGTIAIKQFIRLDRTGSNDDDYYSLDYIEREIEEYLGVRRIKKITQFFQKQFRCLCYVDPDRKCTYVFTERLTLRTYHYLQCGMLVFFPWYFDEEAGITKDEMALIESLRKNTPDDYLSALENLAKQYNFREEFTRKALAGLETRAERQEIENTERHIGDLDAQIADLENRIANILREISDRNIRLLGLRAKVDRDIEEGNESEIMNYFMSNKRLYLQDYNEVDPTFTYSVKDYLVYWDEDIAKSMIKNDRSYAYNPGRTVNVSYSKEDMKNLLTAIFVDRTFKIRICGTYRFFLNGCNVRAVEHYEYGYEFDDSTPNPHLDQYRCLGNYERAINDFLRNNDYVGAIEQTVASVRSLNFADTAVIQEFFRRWYGVSDSGYKINMKCIELPNGEIVDPVGAIEYMHKIAEEAEQDVQESAQESEENGGEDN